MATSGGPKIPTDGLVLHLDAANHRCISPLGNNLFNGAKELATNLLPSNYNIQSVNGVYIGNLNFYTAFAIDYPEGSFGGDAAGRQGITLGLNVRSGSKTYDASRSLHLWVWNNDTNTWISSSFFNGERLSGHCYDSYLGVSSVNTWVNDYNTIKNTFNNITVIAMGSHRDSFHTEPQYEILRDLGAPSNVDSIIGFSSPEWILVGKPGLGADNAYGWSFQNYTTNPSQVAHLNFCLPAYGDKDNYFSFDGTDETIFIGETPDLNNLSYTYAFWIKRKAVQSSSWLQFLQRSTSNRNPGIWFYINEIDRIHFSIQLSNGTNTSINPGGFFQNEWHYFTATVDYNGTNTVMRGYRDGIQVDSLTLSNVAPILGTGFSYIGKQLMDIGNLQIYNRALTADEVLQNFNATKNRFGL
jgi:hypothetical protein